MTSISDSPSAFPHSPGTLVRVTRTVRVGSPSTTANTVGTVESYQQQPTGSWHAHGRDGRLCLNRLLLRKVDGELVLLVIDDDTLITKIEPETTG